MNPPLDFARTAGPAQHIVVQGGDEAIARPARTLVVFDRAEDALLDLVSRGAGGNGQEVVL